MKIFHKDTNLTSAEKKIIIQLWSEKPKLTF